MLLLVFVIHFFFIAYFYVPIIPTILAIIELVLICLFFLRLFKKTNKKYVYIIFFIILIGFLILEVNIIPSIEIIIYDVFGNPVEGIAVAFKDNLGDQLLAMEGGSIHRSIGYKDYYLTDKRGQVKIWPRLYLGQRKLNFTYARINSLYRYNQDTYDIVNNDFDSKTLKISRKGKTIVYLAPLRSNYEECNKISAQPQKSECLVYSLFYSAVKDKNAELCNHYGDEEMLDTLRAPHKHFLSRPSELKNECLIFVAGFLNGGIDICDRIENEGTRDFKDQCKCILSSTDCRDYKNLMARYDQLLGKPVKIHNYLCEGEVIDTEEIHGYKYNNYEIDYLHLASGLYRELFCK